MKKAYYVLALIIGFGLMLSIHAEQLVEPFKDFDSSVLKNLVIE